MKSRLVILTMLVLGMLLSTAGAGLAVSGLSDENATVAQYGTPTAQTTPSGGAVLGDQDEGAQNVAPAEEQGGGNAPSGSAVQPSRQAEAGAETPTGGQLPFTGFAAVPILLGGIALLTAGLVLRRRSGDSR